MTRQMAAYALAIMSTLLGLVLLWQFRVILIYLFVSLLLAAALRPLAQRLAGKKALIKVSLILLYVVVSSGFALLLLQTGKMAINEVQLLVQTISTQNEWRQPIWLGGGALQNALVTQLPAPSKLFEAFTGSQGKLEVPVILGLSKGIGGVVSGFFIIIFLSIYWGISKTTFERLWLSLLPSGQRKQARAIWERVEPDLGLYVRAEVIQSILSGLLLALGFWLMGSPYAVLLALIGALTSLIPVVGAVLAVILVALVGLMTSVPFSLLTSLYTLIILIGLGIWIKRRLFKRNWDNSILTMVILLAMADGMGLVGIILAPALSVVLQVFWRSLVTNRLVSGSETQTIFSDLKARQERVMETLDALDEPPPPMAITSMERLSQLIDKAEPILRAVQPDASAKQSSNRLARGENENQNDRAKKG